MPTSVETLNGYIPIFNERAREFVQSLPFQIKNCYLVKDLLQASGGTTMHSLAEAILILDEFKFQPNEVTGEGTGRYRGERPTETKYGVKVAEVIKALELLAEAPNFKEDKPKVESFVRFLKGEEDGCNVPPYSQIEEIIAKMHDLKRDLADEKSGILAEIEAFGSTPDVLGQLTRNHPVAFDSQSIHAGLVMG